MKIALANRIRELPPYLFARIDALKNEERKKGKDLIDLGLAGIEVIHSDHDAALVAQYNELADRHHLLKTGGSDFHGSNKKDIDLGTARGRKIPRAFFDALTQANVR